MVIVPRGRSRVLGLPKGGAERRARRRSRPPRARCARRRASTARVADRLGQVDYSYRRGGRRIDKTVHFYLCMFEAGDTADHDHEVDDAPLDAAAGRRAARLSYPGEREMIERALSILAANG